MPFYPTLFSFPAIAPNSLLRHNRNKDTEQGPYQRFETAFPANPKSASHSPPVLGHFDLRYLLYNDVERFQRPQEAAYKALALERLRHSLKKAEVNTLKTPNLDPGDFRTIDDLQVLILDIFAKHGNIDDIQLCKQTGVIPALRSKAKNADYQRIFHAFQMAVTQQNPETAKALAQNLPTSWLKKKTNKTQTLLDLVYQSGNPALIDGVKTEFPWWQRLTSYIRHHRASRQSRPKPGLALSFPALLPAEDWLDIEDIQESPPLMG